MTTCYRQQKTLRKKVINNKYISIHISNVTKYTYMKQPVHKHMEDIRKYRMTNNSLSISFYTIKIPACYNGIVFSLQKNKRI